MQIFMKLGIKNTLVGGLVPEVRARAAKVMPGILQSGKVVSSALFTDCRGGYIVLDVGSSEELAELTAGLLDMFDIESHPVVPLEMLPEVLKKLEERGL